MTAIGKLAATNTANDFLEKRLNAFLNASFSTPSFWGGVFGSKKQNPAYKMEIVPETFKVSARRAVASGTSVPTKKGGKI